MRFLIIALTVILTACSGPIIKPKVVYVDKPIVYCPAPSSVANANLLSPSLTNDDNGDPGKVVQYYKADVIQLQGKIKEYQLIVDQYKKWSEQTDKMQKDIDKLYQNNTNVINSQK